MVSPRTTSATILTSALALAEALRILKFKVYDFKAASDRHARDFPLWVEAARLRSEGKPYNQMDYDKVIGDHNALVGAPTCFFGHDFIKLYPNVKVIMVTGGPNPGPVQKFLQKLNMFAMDKVMTHIDADFFGNISTFLKLASKSKPDVEAIRATVREGNLLEVDSLDAWQPLCDFLKLAVPKQAVPPMNNDTTAVELSRRPLEVLHKMVEVHGMKVVRGLQCLCAAAGVSLASDLILEDARDSTVLGFGFITLISAWYWTDRPKPEAVEPEVSPESTPLPASPTIKAVNQNSARSNQNSHQSNRNSRGSRNNSQSKPKLQTNAVVTPRPARPVLAGWGNVQDEIAKDDVVQFAGMKARAEAMAKELAGREVIFHETYNGKTG